MSSRATVRARMNAIQEATRYFIENFGEQPDSDRLASLSSAVGSGRELMAIRNQIRKAYADLDEYLEEDCNADIPSAELSPLRAILKNGIGLRRNYWKKIQEASNPKKPAARKVKKVVKKEEEKKEEKKVPARKVAKKVAKKVVEKDEEEAEKKEEKKAVKKDTSAKAGTKRPRKEVDEDEGHEAPTPKKPSRRPRKTVVVVDADEEMEDAPLDKKPVTRRTRERVTKPEVVEEDEDTYTGDEFDNLDDMDIDLDTHDDKRPAAQDDKNPPTPTVEQSVEKTDAKVGTKLKPPQGYDPVEMKEFVDKAVAQKNVRVLQKVITNINNLRNQHVADEVRFQALDRVDKISGETLRQRDIRKNLEQAQNDAIHKLNTEVYPCVELIDAALLELGEATSGIDTTRQKTPSMTVSPKRPRSPVYNPPPPAGRVAAQTTPGKATVAKKTSSKPAAKETPSKPAPKKTPSKPAPEKTPSKPATPAPAPAPKPSPKKPSPKKPEAKSTSPAPEPAPKPSPKKPSPKSTPSPAPAPAPKPSPKKPSPKKPSPKKPSAEPSPVKPTPDPSAETEEPTSTGKQPSKKALKMAELRADALKAKACMALSGAMLHARAFPSVVEQATKDHEKGNSVPREGLENVLTVQKEAYSDCKVLLQMGEEIVARSKEENLEPGFYSGSDYTTDEEGNRTKLKAGRSAKTPRQSKSSSKPQPAPIDDTIVDKFPGYVDKTQLSAAEIKEIETHTKKLEAGKKLIEQVGKVMFGEDTTGEDPIQDLLAEAGDADDVDDEDYEAEDETEDDDGSETEKEEDEE